jgi:hypothetical protein
MMRKKIVGAVGIIQVIIGVSSIVFTYIFHYNMFDFHAVFNFSLEEASFYLLLFLIVGIFSLISGLFFIQEWRSST